MSFCKRIFSASASLRSSIRWPHYLALLALALPLVATSGGCDTEVMCITSVKGPGYTDVHAVNRGIFPITLNLVLKPTNMSPVAATPSRWVLGPGDSVQLARLEVDDPARPSDFTYQFSWSRGDHQAEHDDGYVYQLPYLQKRGFTVTQGYNGEFSHHGDARYGIDFGMPEGTPIVAAREGTVVGVRADSTVGGPHHRYEAEANYVVIQHADGTFAEYLHLLTDGVRVQEGEQVRRGQLIGLSGNTGFSGGPHLHFMVAGATEDGGRRSFPVRFETSEGILGELQPGSRYASAGTADVSPNDTGTAQQESATGGTLAH